MRSAISMGLVAILGGVAAAQSIDEELNPRPADAPEDAIVADAAVGTGASIQAICATLAQAPDGNTLPCAKIKSKPATKAKAAAPFQAFGVVQRESAPEDFEIDLAVQMDTGAWVLVPLDGWYTEGARDGEVKVSSIKVKDVVPGGHPEILVTGTVYAVKWDDFDNEASTLTSMVWVCGIGAAGVPSCADVVIGLKVRPHPDDGIKPYKLKLSYKFDAAGQIVRKVKGKWPKKAQLHKPDFVNTLPLYFR